MKCWGPPRRQGLCSHPADLWATSDFLPRYEELGTPPSGRGYVATEPTGGPLLTLSPAMKRWGPPRRHGLCSHLAPLWATSDFVPRYEALGTPPSGRGYVATRPTFWPLQILSPALKCWGPPRRQGLSSHWAHLWATCDSLPPFFPLALRVCNIVLQAKLWGYTEATFHGHSQRGGHPSQGPHPQRVAQGAGYPRVACGQPERDQLFINDLAKQLVAELHAACQLNPNLDAKPKSSDTKADLIYKRAFSTSCSGCMFCGLYFPPPFWCTNGGAYKHAIILAPYQCLGVL